MVSRHRYLLMKPSSQANTQGFAYPDVFSFPIEKFTYTEPPEEYALTQPDIDRIDLLMYRKYGTAQYDDVVLWLNSIASIHDLEPGNVLKLPLKDDLEQFFIRNIQ